MKRSGTAALAVAATLIVGAASIVLVDRSEPQPGGTPSSDAAPADPSPKVMPKLPRTNVQSETFGMFTARLPETVSADLHSPATRGPAFELKASEGTEIAIRLRDALGLRGQPEVDADGVIVADTNSDRVLRVVFAPGNPWMMYRGDPACLRTAEAGVGPDGRIFCELGTSGTNRVLAPRTVTSDEARALADDVMAELDIEARNVIVSDNGERGFDSGGGSWGVTVETAVAELPVIGLDTHLVIAEAGLVISGYGKIAKPELVGEYPLIDVGEAQERLLEWLRESAPRSPVESRRGEAPAPAPTTIVGVRLALALSEPSVPPGTRREVSYLAPTLVLDASDGMVFPVPAATAEHLAD